MHRRQHPIGQSLFLLLSACGGSSTPAPDRGDSFVMGRVFADRQVAGARVYVDVNGNARFDEQDHYIGTTDQTGTYHGEIPLEHRGKPLLADLTDARDLSAPTIKLSGIWRAPEGSKIISPMTDLMVMLDKDSEEILNLLNLDSDIDLTIYDPFSDGEPDATDRRVIEIDPNLVQKLIKDKQQLEEKINDLSDVVSVFDGVKLIEVAENHDRNVILYDLDTPPATPGGKFELTKGYIDNHLFSIDPDTGELTVFNFLNSPQIGDSFDYEDPFDKNYDNIYEVEAIYIATDDTSHKTPFEITVTDETANDLNRRGSAISRIAPDDRPMGDMVDIWGIHFYAMPIEGPVQITWGFDLTDGRNGLDDQAEIDTATAIVKKAAAEFEAAANVKFTQSESTNPDDFRLRIIVYDDETIDGNDHFSYITGAITMKRFLDNNSFYNILVHELGHAFGLKHNFDRFVDDTPEWGKKSVMSGFRDQAKTEDVLTDLDEKTLKYIYGPPDPKSTWADFDGAEKRVGLGMRAVDKKYFLDHTKDNLSAPILDMDTVDVFF